MNNTRWSRVILPILLAIACLGTGALAQKAVDTPWLDKDGNLLAGGLKTTFENLTKRIVTLENDIRSLREGSLLMGKPCAKFVRIDDGNLKGYRNANLLCQDTCKSSRGKPSPTAHVCTVPEMVMYLQSGGRPRDATVAAGMEYSIPYGDPSVKDTKGRRKVNDCQGFRSSEHDDSFAVFDDRGVPGSRTCNVATDLACCDFVSSR